MATVTLKVLLRGALRLVLKSKKDFSESRQQEAKTNLRKVLAMVTGPIKRCFETEVKFLNDRIYANKKIGAIKKALLNALSSREIPIFEGNIAIVEGRFADLIANAQMWKIYEQEVKSQNPIKIALDFFSGLFSRLKKRQKVRGLLTSR
ncbi:hypothetical protein HYT52_01970 [Candidatus Woesearchaeota archaeon]|nr:hypothetical protein [Candidatus Woesearchaeota archaeon]